MTTCTLLADGVHTYTGMQNAIQDGQDYVQDCSLSTGSTPHQEHEEDALGNQLAAICRPIWEAGLCTAGIYLSCKQ